MFNCLSATIRLGLCAAILLTPSVASADIVLNYSVPAGSPPTLQFEHPGLDGTEIVRGSSITIVGESYSGWATETADRVAAEAAGSYLDFGFTSNGAFTYDLNNLRIEFSLPAIVPTDVWLGYDINGQGLSNYLQIASGGSQSSNVVTLNENGVSSANFRLVGFSSANSDPANNRLTFTEFPGAVGYSIGLDATAVPEPSTWGLCCLGLMAIACRRRRSAH